MLVWALLGALIGVAASQRKGFSMASGIIGGLLLGPFALLMFLASDRKPKCPHCAEFIHADALVCKHCHRDVVAPPTVR